MPAASPKIYNAQQIQRGAADLWWDVLEPVSPAHVITLFTDGTPDSTSNPSAKHLGLLDSASMLEYTPKFDLEKVDQDTSVVAMFLQEEEAIIEATMKQMTFQNVMQYCMPPGYFTGATPVAEGITMGQGGNVLVTPAPLAVIAPSADPAFKWTVGLLYKAFPSSAIKLEYSKTKTASYQVKFQGIADLTRPAGDRIGSIYRTN